MLRCCYFFNGYPCSALLIVLNKNCSYLWMYVAIFCNQRGVDIIILHAKYCISYKILNQIGNS